MPQETTSKRNTEDEKTSEHNPQKQRSPEVEYTLQKSDEVMDSIDELLAEAEALVGEVAVRSLLEDVDGLLEPNAEEFVAGFRQAKGE